MTPARPLRRRGAGPFKALPGHRGPMRPPEDVTSALRAVWEVRRAEERRAYCLGAWHNIVFGAMGAVIFGAYGLAGWLGATGPLLHWLWLPPMLAAYAALAFATKRALSLPRPTLPWAEVAVGTALFVGLMALLALALANGVLTSIPAGMSMVIGSFYVILGVVLLREAVPALFGAAVALGAVALVLLGGGFVEATLYGIVVTGGGMVAMGAWMLRRPERGAPPAGEPPGDRPPELQQVREALAGIRGHEAAIAARDRAAKTFLAAAVMALAGVVGLIGGGHPAPWALLGVAGLTAAIGLARQRAARAGEARHGA